MRHRSTRRRLIQKPDHARLIQRNLVTSLLLYESIRTTLKRARSVQPIVDRLIATAKRTSPQIAIRSLNAYVMDKNASRKVMEVLTKRYEKRPSGFTRVLKVGSRKGDGAELVDLLLVDHVVPTKAEAPKKAAAAKAAPKKKTTTPSETDVPASA